MDEYIKDRHIMGFLKAKADLFKKMEMFYKAFGKRELWMEEGFFMIRKLVKFHKVYGWMVNFKVKIF